MLDVRTDIDIDFADRSTALSEVLHIPAVEDRNGRRQVHQSGVYFHDIPCHPLDGMAAWDYETAENYGFFKIDFLNNTIYKGVRDEGHLVQLLTTEPPWAVFMDPDIVAGLAHIGKHFDIVQQIAPTSILDLAVCIALIRPGKKYLVGKTRAEIDREIWLPTKDYYYKKSHAISFAGSIIVQLNLLIEKAHEQATSKADVQ